MRPARFDLSGTLSLLAVACFIAVVFVVPISRRVYRFVTHAPGPIHAVDGDTVRRDQITYRLDGFDAPESGGRAKCSAERIRANAATARLRQLLATASQSDLQITGRPDRYQRELARLIIDGEDIAAIAISEGWGMPYDGRGKRTDWCAPPAQINHTPASSSGRP